MRISIICINLPNSIMKDYYGKYFIAEKPNFKVAPHIKLLLGRHCYLLPTGCGFSKSMHQHTFDSGYNPADVYKCEAYMVTYAYTFYFLWFRLHIAFRERKMSSSLMQTFRATDKSKSTIEDFISK